VAVAVSAARAAVRIANLSPHVVICAPCVEGVVQAMHGEAIDDTDGDISI
jgi:hypothetical protein